MGGQAVDDDTIRALLGAPRGEVQHELADVVAIGDVRGAFEVVGRLVHDGQDLRNVVAESLAHFRNLLLVKTAPGQEDLLDIAGGGYEALRIQAEKFTTGELARVLSLLLAAQTDMRWTTSPRLTLELALVRSCAARAPIPTPAGMLGRARAPGAAGQPGAGHRRAGGGRGRPVARRRPGDGRSPCRNRCPRRPRFPRRVPVDPRLSPRPEPGPGTQLPVPHAADAGSVDVAMLRRSWRALLEHLGRRANRCSARSSRAPRSRPTTATTLELAFPPGKKSRHDAGRGSRARAPQALSDLFGVRAEVTLRRARVAERRRHRAHRRDRRRRGCARRGGGPRAASRRCSAPQPIDGRGD